MAKKLLKNDCLKEIVNETQHQFSSISGWGFFLACVLSDHSASAPLLLLLSIPPLLWCHHDVDLHLDGISIFGRRLVTRFRCFGSVLAVSRTPPPPLLLLLYSPLSAVFLILLKTWAISKDLMCDWWLVFFKNVSIGLVWFGDDT